MITKILFTAAVIIVAMLFVKHQSRGSSAQARAEADAQSARERRLAMFMAIGVVALTLAISAGLYYWHWQGEHRIVEVRVVNGHTGAEQTYHVYQGEIDGRRFRTVEGRLISLSDAERMEVQGDVPGQ